MMNFLIATWEGGGSVMPMLTVARKLADRGHRVRVMSDQCNRPEAEAAGAAFIPWRRAPSRPDRSRESDTFRDWEAETPQEQIRLVLDRSLGRPGARLCRGRGGGSCGASRPTSSSPARCCSA